MHCIYYIETNYILIEIVRYRIFNTGPARGTHGGCNNKLCVSGKKYVWPSEKFVAQRRRCVARPSPRACDGYFRPLFTAHNLSATTLAQQNSCI